jgi:hypothetical protein
METFQKHENEGGRKEKVNQNSLDSTNLEIQE